MLGGPTLIVHAYLTGLAMEGAVLERQLVGKVAKVKFNLLSLSALFWFVRYGVVRWLLYERMMVRFQGYGTLRAVPIELVGEWLKLSVLKLIRNMEGDLVLALVAVACVTEVE